VTDTVDQRPLRIIHCPMNVAGQPAMLAAAERRAGADSRCIVIEETLAGFPADECLIGPRTGAFARESARWRLLWRVLEKCDVAHFYFGQSCLVPNARPSLDRTLLTSPLAAARRLYSRLVWLADLPLLSRLGKTIAITWQGDDARQHDRSLELFDISIAHTLGNAYYPAGSDAWKRKTIAAFDRWATLHYAVNPDLLHVLPARAQFLPYASFDVVPVTPRYPAADESRPLRFAHAPSHRGAKGTDRILAALDRLRDEGHGFELDLVEGLPREAALARYANCDVMIDQLLAGWYGGLAVEAMALGKPVVVFIRNGDLARLDSEFVADMPFVHATIDTIYDVLKRLLEAPRQDITALGHGSRAFVTRWHDPDAIARRTIAQYHATRSART
jgi:glycosyltransferase involved in cell wall biosynthesis